jgi:hypothetical protein
MAQSEKVKGSSDLFQEYLNEHKDEVRANSADDYYHVNIVADAYKQGFSDGTQSAQKEFVEQLIEKRIDDFKKKAQQVYILSSKLVSVLEESGFIANALYIAPTFMAPRAIIVVPEEHVLNDDFVETTYSKIHEFREIFSKLFHDVLDLSIVGNDNLDTDLLKEDGFGYEEVYTS